MSQLWFSGSVAKYDEKREMRYTSLVVHLSGIHIYHYAFSEEHDDDDDDTTQDGVCLLPTQAWNG